MMGEEEKRRSGTNSKKETQKTRSVVVPCTNMGSGKYDDGDRERKKGKPEDESYGVAKTRLAPIFRCCDEERRRQLPTTTPDSKTRSGGGRKKGRVEGKEEDAEKGGGGSQGRQTVL